MFCDGVPPVMSHKRHTDLKVDSWDRGQLEVGPNHAHNAPVLSAQLTVPHWNQLEEQTKHNTTHTQIEKSISSYAQTQSISVCLVYTEAAAAGWSGAGQCALTMSGLTPK